MHVLSVEWLAVMAGCVGIYWLLPARLRDLWVVVLTAGFLAVLDPRSLALLVGFTLVTWAAGRLPAARRRLVFYAVGAMVVALVGYKLEVGQSPVSDLADVVIPLGMSYYTLRCIHYLLDRYRGTAPAASLFELAAYLFFLPTIIAGPIHRSAPFIRDLHRKTWQANDISRGLERILYGYVKIAFIANFAIAGLSNYLLTQIDDNNAALQLYIATIAGGLNLYFQFSGFSDVAIGFALLLGYRVIENFDRPFLQRNLGLFWQRWHISLTSLSREYVYMPLVGLTRNPYLASYAAFIAIGLWHSISLNLVAWGAYNATGIIVWQEWKKLGRRLAVPPVRTEPWRAALHVFSVLLTAHYFLFGYFFIGYNDLEAGLADYYTMLFAWWLP